MSSEAKEEIYQDLPDIDVLFACLEAVRLHVQPVWEELHDHFNRQFKSIELTVQVMIQWQATGLLKMEESKTIKTLAYVTIVNHFQVETC